MADFNIQWYGKTTRRIAMFCLQERAGNYHCGLGDYSIALLMMTYCSIANLYHRTLRVLLDRGLFMPLYSYVLRDAAVASSRSSIRVVPERLNGLRSHRSHSRKGHTQIVTLSRVLGSYSALDNHKDNLCTSLGMNLDIVLGRAPGYNSDEGTMEFWYLGDFPN